MLLCLRSDAILQPSRYQTSLFALQPSLPLSTAWRPPHHANSLDVPHTEFSSSSPRPRYTSVSSPSSPYAPQTTAISLPPSFIPPSLTPGRRPRTSHGSISPTSLLSPQRQSLYGDYFTSPQPPPLPQKPQALLKSPINPLPPIPPKPAALAIAPASRIPLYPTSIPLPVVSPPSQPPEPIVTEATSPVNQKEVDFALTISASETRKREQELIAQEEEELARALEESRLLSTTTYTLNEQLSSSLKPPPLDRASISAIRASAHPPEGESWLHLITPTPSTSSQYSSQEGDFSSLRSSVNQDEFDDPSDFPRETPNDVQTVYMPRDTSSQTPSLYANIASNLARHPLPALSPSNSTITPSSPSATSTTYLQSDYTPSSERVPPSPSLSRSLSSKSSSSEQSPMPPFTSRPSWPSASSENSSSAGHSLGSDLVPASSGYKSPTYPSASPDLSSAPLANLDTLDEGAEEADAEPGPSTRPVVPLSANQYVEREMLMGVCMSSKVHPASLFTPSSSCGLQSSGHFDRITAYG